MQPGLDRVAERARVGFGIEPYESLTDGRIKRVGGEQTGERRLGVIPSAASPDPVMGLLDQMQDRLEQVVVDPHLIVERVERRTLLGGVEAGLAEVRPDQSIVLLFDEPVVVLLIRS